MNSYDTESYILSRTMNRIGFSQHMITFRQKAFKTVESLDNRSLQGYELDIVWTGSKAEGLRATFENDTDKMYVPTSVLCTEKPAPHSNRDEINLFHVRLEDTPAGYTLLQPYKTSCNFPFTILQACLVERLPEQVYLSSELWRNNLKHLYLQNTLTNRILQVDLEEHGPSIATLAHNFYSFDTVICFVCECPTYMNAWLQRKRCYQWPSAEVIRDVSQLTAHVVPVGYINSSLKFLEWRICFTQGELRLLKSLNDCLTKVIVLLKEIAKVTLKPICKEMSTYVMKNVVLWVAELNNPDNFVENKLISTLMLTLQFLKRCIIASKLPSYMIPERNLLADRVTFSQKKKLCLKIESLLKEGPRIILNCRKMKNALAMLYRSPEEFSEHFKRHQRVEMLSLLMLIYTARQLPSFTGYTEFIADLLSDDVFIKLVRSIINTIPETLSHGMEWLHADMGPPSAENVEIAIDFLNTAGQMKFKNVPYFRHLVE